MADMTRHYRQLVGIAKGWALKHLPGWCDDIHRDLLARHGATSKDGHISASTMTQAQLRAVLDDYERRGWPRRKGFGRTQIRVTPQIRMIASLWGQLGQAGKLDNASRPAMLAYCSRMLDIPVGNLDDLNNKQRSHIIECLKNWLDRD